MRDKLCAAMLMAASSFTWLYAAGGLDTRFGVDGIVVTPTARGAALDLQGGLAIQRYGTILVGGQSDMGDAGGSSGVSHATRGMVTSTRPLASAALY